MYMPLGKASLPRYHAHAMPVFPLINQSHWHMTVLIRRRSNLHNEHDIDAVAYWRHRKMHVILLLVDKLLTVLSVEFSYLGIV